MTKEIDTNPSELTGLETPETPIAAPDPFDPASIRVSPSSLVAAAAQKALIQVPVRKPHKQVFVRVHREADYRVDACLYEDKENRETYLVAKHMQEEMVGETFLARLYTAITRQGIVFLWPCKLPDPDGRSNSWHTSAVASAELAMENWVRVIADMQLGGYQPYIGRGIVQEPEWPDMKFGQLLRLAFQGFHIDSPDHPVIKNLRGHN